VQLAALVAIMLIGHPSWGANANAVRSTTHRQFSGKMAINMARRKTTLIVELRLMSFDTYIYKLRLLGVIFITAR